MTRCFPRRTGLLAATLLCAALGVSLPVHAAQAQPATAPAPLTPADVQQLAKVQVALLSLQDSLNAIMAQSRNKTEEAQSRLKEELFEHVEAILKSENLSDAEFRRRRFEVSTVDSLRLAFDTATAKLLGAPLPGSTVASTQSKTFGGGGLDDAPAATAASATASTAQPEMPAGPAGTHLGHVLVSFMNTPDKAGLLAVAKMEAATAAQHAEFAQRTPTNLLAMQTHAGHVLHALDPELIPVGPGKGYGVKKAAAGVAAHIELAAKAEGASAGLKTHAGHVAAAAQSTVERADAIIVLAQKVREATDAAVADALISQIVSLTSQLTTGVDLDGNGQVSWGGGEGGLQQAEAHAKLALTAATAK